MHFLKILFLGFTIWGNIFSEIYKKDDKTEEFRDGIFGKNGAAFEEYLRQFPEVRIVSISEHRTLACHEYALNEIFGEQKGEKLYGEYEKTVRSSDSGQRMSKIIEDFFEETPSPSAGDLAVYYVHNKRDSTKPPIISHSGIFVSQNHIKSLWERHLLDAPTFYYPMADEVRYFRKKR